MRVRRAIALVAGACAVAALAFGCAAGDGLLPVSNAPPTEPIDLVVLHTNDLWGETDPCG